MHRQINGGYCQLHSPSVKTTIRDGRPNPGAAIRYVLRVARPTGVITTLQKQGLMHAERLSCHTKPNLFAWNAFVMAYSFETVFGMICYIVWHFVWHSLSYFFLAAFYLAYILSAIILFDIYFHKIFGMFSCILVFRIRHCPLGSAIPGL